MMIFEPLISHHNVRVYLEDTDKFGVVYHANYIRYFERGRTEWLRDKNLTVTQVGEHGFSLMVAKITVNYLKPAYLDDCLIISTELAKHKMSVAIFNQSIYTEKNDLIANAQVKVVSLDTDNNLCNISNILSL